jgi:riboflavin biosynthesis pyrimidine reductase
MTQAVQDISADSALAGLPEFYRDAPDGVRVNMILSLDGAAAFHGLAGPLSNECDQNLLVALRGFADVVLVGAGTVRAENYGPVCLTPAQVADRRDRYGITDIPPIAVVTRSGNLPASLFADHRQRPLLVTTTELAHRRPELRERADLLLAGETEVDIAAAVERLRIRGFRRVLCEGGPTLLDELIAADLVDDMCLTLSPTLTAAAPAVHPGVVALQAPTRLTLHHAFVSDDYAYLRYSRLTAAGNSRDCP